MCSGDKSDKYVVRLGVCKTHGGVTVMKEMKNVKPKFVSHTGDLLDERTAIVDGYNSYFSFSRGRSGYSGLIHYHNYHDSIFLSFSVHFHV